MNKGIELTPGAQEHIKASLAATPEALGIRLAAIRAGCSGYMYHIEPVTEPSADDQCFAQPNGLQVYVDPQSLPLLEGLVVDFVSEGINRVLRFNNPNAEDTCGCGESFSVRDSA